MKTVLDLYRAHGPGPLKQKGPKEWAGPCPECGGEDRFVLQPENPNGTGGRWMCRGCDRYGDAVGFVQAFVDPGLSYNDACYYIGTDPKPGYGSRGNGWSSRPRQERAPAQADTAPDEWTPKEALLPSAEWMERAAAFTAHCVRAALGTVDGRAALASRGLTPETAQHLGIGWNSQNRRESLAAWGLPEEIKPDTGRPRKMWLPKGLVVPFRRKCGIVGLFIRRMPWTPEDKLPKCWQVKGGTDGAYCAGPAGLPVIVLESILDACLVRQEAGDLVSAVALTGATKRPDKDTLAFLQAAPLLLWALDNDEAGKAQWAWWRQHFPRAERCRPPGGPKDIGDYLQAGGSVRIWAQASLYNAQHREVAVPDTCAAHDTAETAPDSPADASAAEIWTNSHETATDAAHGQPEADAARAEEGQATGGQGVPGTSLPAETAAPSPLPSQEEAAGACEKAPDGPSGSAAAGRRGNTQAASTETNRGRLLRDALAPFGLLAFTLYLDDRGRVQCIAPEGWEQQAARHCEQHARILQAFLAELPGHRWTTDKGGFDWLELYAWQWGAGCEYSAKRAKERLKCRL